MDTNDVEPNVLFRNIRFNLKENGVAIVIIQLPSESYTQVTKTKYKSLELLNGFMKSYSLRDFNEILTINGFEIIEQQMYKTEFGKHFGILSIKNL
ncbi:MAG: hypothetical protein JXR48_14775 [Candidatus Delongbacteria bacterium]|nr:hypothetical protein [Candidatus Delongbacteria bacterium]MBN2836221.1 hypothetical protein [Candidatus Delongbacteria bacterium]